MVSFLPVFIPEHSPWKSIPVKYIIDGDGHSGNRKEGLVFRN